MKYCTNEVSDYPAVYILFENRPKLSESAKLASRLLSETPKSLRFLVGFKGGGGVRLF